MTTLGVGPPDRHQLGRAALHGILAWMIDLSQIVRTPALPSRTALRQPLRSKPTPHGIDFKNPFTMSKRARSAQHRSVAAADLGVFIKLDCCSDGRRRGKAASSIMAETMSAALTAFAVVEPIGIEPMT